MYVYVCMCMSCIHLKEPNRTLVRTPFYEFVFVWPTEEC